MYIYFETSGFKMEFVINSLGEVALFCLPLDGEPKKCHILGRRISVFLSTGRIMSSKAPAKFIKQLHKKRNLLIVESDLRNTFRETEILLT